MTVLIRKKNNMKLTIRSLAGVAYDSKITDINVAFFFPLCVCTHAPSCVEAQ